MHACMQRDRQRLTCVHADADQHKEENEKQHLLGVWMMGVCVREDVLPADAD